MGKINIEYVNAAALNHNVSISNSDGFTVDATPIDFADTSFHYDATTSTTPENDTAPTGTTHAVVTSVSGVHLVRVGATNPTTTTGGVAVASGGTRVLQIGAGEVLRYVATA